MDVLSAFSFILVSMRGLDKWVKLHTKPLVKVSQAEFLQLPV